MINLNAFTPMGPWHGDQEGAPGGTPQGQYYVRNQIEKWKRVGESMRI